MQTPVRGKFVLQVRGHCFGIAKRALGGGFPYQRGAFGVVLHPGIVQTVERFLQRWVTEPITRKRCGFALLRRCGGFVIRSAFGRRVG